jgi:TM2 domain-containing membrane protein YozV
MQCPNCQAVLPDASSFCNHCGYDLRPRAAAPAGMVAQPAKDPNTAFLIELVGTLFGFMGLGWIYAGYTNKGVIMLIVWLVVVVVAAVISVLTAGIFACVWLPAQVIAAVVSASQVKQAVVRDYGPRGL